MTIKIEFDICGGLLSVEFMIIIPEHNFRPNFKYVINPIPLVIPIKYEPYYCTITFLKFVLQTDFILFKLINFDFNLVEQLIVLCFQRILVLY